MGTIYHKVNAGKPDFKVKVVVTYSKRNMKLNAKNIYII